MCSSGLSQGFYRQVYVVFRGLLGFYQVAGLVSVFLCTVCYMGKSPAVFDLPLDGSFRVEPVTFFLSNVAPAGSYGSWSNVADQMFNDHDCMVSIVELAQRLSDGVTLDPVVVGFDYTGVLCVYNGMHRTLAHVLADVPVTYATEDRSDSDVLWVSVTDERLADDEQFDLLWSCVHSLPASDGWVSLEFASGHFPPDGVPSAELGLVFSPSGSASAALSAVVDRIAEAGFVAVHRPDLSVLEN